LNPAVQEQAVQEQAVQEQTKAAISPRRSQRHTSMNEHEQQARLLDLAKGMTDALVQNKLSHIAAMRGVSAHV
jgi:hypothetical protein